MDHTRNAILSNPAATEHAGGQPRSKRDQSPRSRLATFLWMALAGQIGIACNTQPEAEDNLQPRTINAEVWATSRPDNNTILGMELPTAWSIATPGATIAQSTTHTQGSYSLAVRPSNSNGYTPIKSVAMTSLVVVSPTLSVDVKLPTYQPNPNWLGTAQAYIDCPSRGIHSQFLNQVELTGKPLNVWTTINFSLTNDWVSRLLQSGYSDLSITVVLNVQVPTTGTYLVDNVRFSPVASNKCSGMPNGTACTGGGCQGGLCVVPATPTKVIATPSTINPGQASTISATSPTPGTTLAWFAGSSCTGTSLGTGSSFSTGPLTSTTAFSVHAEIGAASSPCATVTVTVISAPATPTDVIATPSTINVGESSLITATNPTAGATLEWFFSADCTGTSIGTGATVGVGFLAQTSSYSVHAVKNGLVSGCASVLITVIPA